MNLTEVLGANVSIATVLATVIGLFAAYKGAKGCYGFAKSIVSKMSFGMVTAGTLLVTGLLGLGYGTGDLQVRKPKSITPPAVEQVAKTFNSSKELTNLAATTSNADVVKNILEYARTADTSDADVKVAQVNLVQQTMNLAVLQQQEAMLQKLQAFQDQLNKRSGGKVSIDDAFTGDSGGTPAYYASVKSAVPDPFVEEATLDQPVVDGPMSRAQLTWMVLTGSIGCIICACVTAARSR